MAGAAGETLGNLFRGGGGGVRVLRVGGEEPQHDADAEDDGAGALQEKAGALEHLHDHVAQPRQPVGRQFHDHHGRRALEQRALEKPREAEGAQRAERIHEQHDAGLRQHRHGVAGQQRGDHQQVDGEARRAAHERGDEDGHKPVLGILDGARGHNAGNRAGVGAEQRDEGFAVEANAAHQPIHDERGAGHVAGILQQPDEEKQNQDLRQKHQHAADAGDDSIGEQVAEVTGSHRALHPGGERGNLGIDPVHRDLGEGENREEQRSHHSAEHEPAPERVDDDGVDLVGGGRAGGAGLRDDVGAEFGDGLVAAADERAGPVSPLARPAFLPVRENFCGAGAQGRGAGDAHRVEIGQQQQRLGARDERRTAVTVGERGLQFGYGRGDGAGHIPAVARQRQINAAHRELQLDDTLAVDGLAGDDGDAQFLFEAGDADLQAGGFGEIHHVHDEDDGAAEIEYLMNEVEVPLEICGVDDAEDAVGLRRVGPAAEEDVAGDRLVGRAGGERVGARKIDELDRLAVLRVGLAHLLLDRDARIVAHFLLQAGEGVEERALAAVWIAHERVNGCAVAGRGALPARGNNMRGQVGHGSGFHGDLRSLRAPEREVVATKPELQRVAERRGAHEGDGRARQQTHLAEAEESRAGRREILHAHAGAERELRKFERGRHGAGFSARFPGAAPRECSWRRRG